MRRRALTSAVIAGGLVVGACTGGADASRVNAATAATVALRDSAAYESELGGGTMAVLYVSGTYVDSIDAMFGVTQIGEDSLLYLPVRSSRLYDDDHPGIDISRHVLAVGQSRRELEGWLPYFDSYFSSPVVHDRALYYWGLDRLEPEGGSYDLYAMRYTFGSGAVDSLRLGRVGLYTDNRFHLPPPTPTDSGIVFVGDSGTYVIRRDFRAGEHRPRASRPAI